MKLILLLIILFEILQINFSLKILKSNQIKIAIISSISSLFFPNAVISVDTIDISSLSTSSKTTTKSNDILFQRLGNNPVYSNSYKPGILSTDVYYPKFFEGIWKSSSRFSELYTPLGEEIFGGKNALDTAKNDIGSILVYNSRFSHTDNDNIISDRLYNLKSIATASMGEKSIVDETQRSKDLANNINLIVSPIQSNGAFFDINLKVTDREYKNVDNKLYVLERTRQTIRNVIPQTEFSNQRISQPSLQKEIETITSYEKINDNALFSKQRTATYLCNLDPRYEKLIEKEPRISDTAIDIRYYEITYNRIK